MSTIDDILARGKAAAERLLNRVVDAAFEVTPLRSLKDMLENTAEAERDLVDLAHRIKALDAIGYATPEDFYGFNTTRRNITELQRKLLDASRKAFFDRPEILGRLPTTVTDWPPLVPTRASTFLARDPYAQASQSATATLGNLGNPALVAAPALALEGWMICAIILTAIVAFAVVAYAGVTTLGVSVESISNILIVREQIRGLKVTVEARMQIYNDCIARQGDAPDAVAECARIAVSTIPTPRDAQVQVPEVGGWVKWVTIGLGVVALASIGGYLLYQKSKARPQLSGARASFKPIRRERFPDENANDQGLPVRSRR